MTRGHNVRTRAIVLASLTAAFTAAALAFQAISGEHDVAETLLVSSFAVVGLIISLRVPDNRLGWFYLGLAVLNSFASMTGSLMFVARDIWDLPNLAKACALASSWEWFAFVGGIPTFGLLLFPDGRLPSRRWRWVARLSAVSIAGGCLMLLAMTASDLDLAVADPEAEIVGPPWMNAVLTILLPLVLACALACFASLVVRWRRSRGVERQQLKWFLLGGLVQLLGIAAGFFDSAFINGMGEAAILALPAAATLGILKYRLYDIDRLISRTLAYALLTALLLGLYLLAVSALTALTAPVTRDSPIAVAAATLVAAAAFGPARRRIQSWVDHRFNRARYDAARTAEAYRARLRDELDLVSIGDDLVGTAGAALQPQTALLWLRDSGAAS